MDENEQYLVGYKRFLEISVVREVSVAGAHQVVTLNLGEYRKYLICAAILAKDGRKEQTLLPVYKS